MAKNNKAAAPKARRKSIPIALSSLESLTGRVSPAETARRNDRYNTRLA